MNKTVSMPVATFAPIRRSVRFYSRAGFFRIIRAKTQHVREARIEQQK